MRVVAFLILIGAAVLPVIVNGQAADQLLMTLRVDSSTVRWQDDFVLSLEIYGAPSENPPFVVIDGLDQFQINGQGRNLLQVPGGKTVKWILTYNLTAIQDGTFKVGPARGRAGNKTYNSNTIFITVEGGGGKRPPPKETVQVPLIRSAKEVGDKIIIVAETSRKNPFRNESVVITYRLLSQLPVESLRFTEEAEFPGFLKYDFPYTARPQAQRVQYKGASYVSYDIQKFMIFPIKEGTAELPPVDCEMQVRVPSGSFRAADLMLEVFRKSNPINLEVRPLPAPAVVGNFVLKNEIVSDTPQTKVIRLILEGEGLLTTYEFPELSGPGYQARTVSTSISAAIRGQKLHSRKAAEIEILAEGNTTDIVLSTTPVRQFDPSRAALTDLALPPLPLRFARRGAPAPAPAPMPDSSNTIAWLFVFAPALTSLILAARLYQPKPKPKPPSFHKLFRKKKPNLQISRSSAHILYQQISDAILSKDDTTPSLMETLRRHLPMEEWLYTERIFKKLESSAFSASKGTPLTYQELMTACDRVERRWSP
jgi:hypothetical protein